MKELVDQLRTYKWNSVTVDQLIALIRPGIKITTELIQNEKLAVGTSRFGGLPEVPLNFIWPRKEGQPMAFIAQINCEEVFPFDEEKLLPEKGMLYFFYLVDEENQYCPTSPDEYKVIYFEGRVENLSQISFPEDLGEWSQIDACRMNFSKIYSLPTSPYNSHIIADLSLSSNDETNLQYIDHYLYEKKGFGSESHQLLGEVESTQNDVRYDWAWKYLGLRPNELDEYERKKIALLEKDFTLLLEINPFDSNSNLTNLSGNAAMYFGIRKEALAFKTFEEVYLTCQGT